MRRLHSYDWAILGYLAVITAIVLVARPVGWWIYLAYHALALALMGLLVYSYGRFGGRFWEFLRVSYALPVTLAAFRELYYLVPQVHPFDDHRYDRALAEIDRRWLGDVDGFLLSIAHPVLIDFLHGCYWAYFALNLVPPIVLFVLREAGKLREFLGVQLTAFYLSYLGYLLVPAVGPHHFFGSRPPELDGWRVGAPLHRALLAIEWRTADAFPSGHALLCMVVLVMMARLHRPTFWTLLVPCLGCIAATMALRYHYVVDVVASVGLLPAAVLLGRRVNVLASRER